MPSIRRGFPSGVAAAPLPARAAKAGCMASNQGGERRMPAPRRNRRRERARRVETKGPVAGVWGDFDIYPLVRLFVQKQIARDNFMDQAPNTVTLRAAVRQYLRDGRAVGEPDWGAGGI